MSCIDNAEKEVVSARVYGLILTSQRLKEKLLPQGLVISPYEIIRYETTLTLHDTRGMSATFERWESIRFLQDGVAGILDHVWGDGVLMTSYENDAGSLEDSFVDEGRRHLVIGLPRPMGRGETMSFVVRRGVMAGFTGSDEWLEVSIDHPVRHLRAQILFPRARPVRHVMADHHGMHAALPIQRLADGTTAVRLETSRARAHSPYLMRWSW